MTQEKLTLTEVFGRQTDHQCCECCTGYCPLNEAEPDTPTDPVYRMIHPQGTIAYLSNKYIAIREDLIDTGTHTGIMDINFKDWKFGRPLLEPGPSTRHLKPAFVRRMTQCGIDIRQGPEGKPQHLYRDGQYIGFMMPAVSDAGRGPVMTLDQVEEVRAYAAWCTTHGWPVEFSGDEWDAAAGILNEIRARHV